MHDPMQDIFDGAEAAQDALYHLGGCENALRMALDPVLGKGPDAATVWAIVASIGHFRQSASAEVARLQRVTFG